jgi:hypothetical protein
LNFVSCWKKWHCLHRVSSDSSFLFVSNELSVRAQVAWIRILLEAWNAEKLCSVCFVFAINCQNFGFSFHLTIIQIHTAYFLTNFLWSFILTCSVLYVELILFQRLELKFLVDLCRLIKINLFVRKNCRSLCFWGQCLRILWVRDGFELRWAAHSAVKTLNSLECWSLWVLTKKSASLFSWTFWRAPASSRGGEGCF